MLTRLAIRNIVLIEALDLDFGRARLVCAGHDDADQAAGICS